MFRKTHALDHLLLEVLLPLASLWKQENSTPYLKCNTQNKLHCSLLTVSNWGNSKLTLGVDGEYCIVVGVVALSYHVESINREVVSGFWMQTSNCEGCCIRWKDVYIQEAD